MPLHPAKRLETIRMPFPTRDQAFAILSEHTQGESLLKHAFAVEASMRHYAGRFGADPEA